MSPDFSGVLFSTVSKSGREGPGSNTSLKFSGRRNGESYYPASGLYDNSFGFGLKEGQQTIELYSNSPLYDTFLQDKRTLIESIHGKL